jgi:HK97 family phage major capsid protein
VKVEPQQMAVLVYVTEKLLRNSPVALEQYVSRSATSEISFMTGDAIVNGSGAGQPKGLQARRARSR